MYIDVLLPLYLNKLLSYGVPPELEEHMATGVRVSVNVGLSKIYSGIVVNIHDGTRDRLKNILEVIDGKPVATADQLKIWQWMAEYYLCTPGEVMKQFLPSSMRITGKLGGETFDYDSSHSISYKKQLYIPEGTDMDQALEMLGKAKKQQEAYLYIIGNGEVKDGEICIWRDSVTSAGFPSNIIRALIFREILKEREERVFNDYRDDISSGGNYRLKTLTKEQTRAYNDICKSEKHNKPVLLHGAPGSGKTEIYLHLIKKHLDDGKNVLVLLPEIGLSAQVQERITGSFPENTVLYNARLTDKKRYAAYNRILSGDRVVVVGTRIAIGLPLSNLGLVIVDEEGDPSYKQSEKRPFFQARDTAVMMGHFSGAEVLLVSSAPSVETYYNCVTGKYSLVKIGDNEHHDRRITVIDRRHIALKDKKLYGYRYDTRYFSKLMLTRIKETLERGEQVLVLHNRRGFAYYIECSECGQAVLCPNCNVAMSIHKASYTLECRYCGLKTAIPKKCPECGGNMLLHGIGAENVEETLKKYFPLARIAGVDGEMIKNSYQTFKRTLEETIKGKIDIVVGTQVIAKGLVFPHATLGCIINADIMLNYPDFRAEERTYQLITQFAGRTAGKEKRTETIIQTSQPGKDIFHDIVYGDYTDMYEREIAEREKFGYPPFSRLIRITLKHQDENIVCAAAEIISEKLREVIGDIVKSPETPLVNKVRNMYLMYIYINAPKGKKGVTIKSETEKLLQKLNNERFGSKITFDINIDA